MKTHRCKRLGYEIHFDGRSCHSWYPETDPEKIPEFMRSVDGDEDVYVRPFIVQPTQECWECIEECYPNAVPLK